MTIAIIGAAIAGPAIERHLRAAGCHVHRVALCERSEPQRRYELGDRGGMVRHLAARSSCYEGSLITPMSL